MTLKPRRSGAWHFFRASIGVAAWAGCSAQPPSQETAATLPDGGEVVKPIVDASVPSSGDSATRPGSAYREIAGVMHYHSVYSKDACDGHGLTNGVPDANCLAALRAAVCDNGVDYLGLTDHPSHMRDYPFEKLVLHNAAAGDQLVVDKEGAAIANRLACPGGRSVLVTVGYETNHALPLNFRKHPKAPFYESIVDSNSLQADRDLVAGLHEAGGIVSLAHPEQPDLSATRIAESGVDMMEWYNFHGNLMYLLGSDVLSGSVGEVWGTLKALSDFFPGGDARAHADLAYMVLRNGWPDVGFEKWQKVQGMRRVTGMLGSDVHQNVVVSPMCTQSDALQRAACVAGAKAVLPGGLDDLVNGGPVRLHDGERIDSYGRVTRYVQNRLLVKDLTFDAVQEALVGGRVWGAFTYLGDPRGFSFRGMKGTAMSELGDTCAPPCSLEIQVPAPVPLAKGVPFTPAEAQKASVSTRLYRIEAKGTVRVETRSGMGVTHTVQTTAAGGYFVEVWIKPTHMASHLGGRAELAEREYLWAITNPIWVR